jgi:MFS family permease
LIGLAIAVLILKKIGRRTLLYSGHIVMAVCHALVGVFAFYNESVWVVVMMVAFVFFYQVMNGPVVWLYVSEVVVDTALGLAIFTLWATVLVLSLTTNFLMESALKPQGVFWIFAGISIFGSLFCFIFVRETKGLNDKDKKMLYSPTHLKRQVDESSYISSTM